MANDASMDFISCLMTLLTRELTLRDGHCLERKDIEELLAENAKITEENPRKSITGYPTRPLYVELGARFNQWYSTRSCPTGLLVSYDLLDEKDYVIKRNEIISEIGPRFERIKSLRSCWSEDELLYSIKEIIELLGKRGLLDLLGMRKTVGTADHWPPARRILENTFCAKHSVESSSVLTVGARALAKHCHRDESSSWWGSCTGSENAKNEHAFKKVSQILDNATWINIHQLPHDVVIIEARQENGYGARWTCDGQQFRGFLEPQMIDGHEVGWKH